MSSIPESRAGCIAALILLTVISVEGVGFLVDAGRMFVSGTDLANYAPVIVGAVFGVVLWVLLFFGGGTIAPGWRNSPT